MDPRATQLAKVLIDHSLAVAPDDKLVICASDFTPLDLIHECYRLGIERGAFVELDMFGLQYQRGRADFGGFIKTFLSTASEKQLTTPSEISINKMNWGTKFLFIIVQHDDHFLEGVDPKKISIWNTSQFATFEPLFQKTWVLTQVPVENLAKKSDMTLEEFTDFYYQSCLINYPEEAKRLKALQDILDAGSSVRIQAAGTDLKLGIKGRLAAGTDIGSRNVPDGECFLAPLEEQTEGEITFELPQLRSGNEITGIHLEFHGGKTEKATATSNEELLIHTLDEHPDNRRFGELGIGMNRFITKYIKQILFDEKIAGTVHLALGRAYKEERGGGLNGGTIHWDLVKDLRYPGTLVTVDDRVIIKDGEVLV